MHPIGDDDDQQKPEFESHSPDRLVSLPRLTAVETRRRLLLVCEKLQIDPDSPEAAEIAELIATGADISILEGSD